MDIRSALRVLILSSCLAFPAVSNADAIYTLDLDFSSTPGSLAAGSIVDVQFSVPSILTTDTTISSFLSDSVGGSFTGCTISSVSIPSTEAISGTFVASALVNFASNCSTIPGDVGEISGALGFFQQSITSPGVYSAYYLPSNPLVIGTLTIGTPEPGAALLAGIGLICLLSGARIRWRFRHI